MRTRITDLFIGLFAGFYLPKTVFIFGMNVHWVVVALCIIFTIHVSKKIGVFLWKKLIAAIAKELQKQNDLKM